MSQPHVAATAARPRRATQRDFVDSGFAILAESDAGVFQSTSCAATWACQPDRYYHHFANWDHYVTVLLAHWEGDQERQMKAAATAESQLRRIEIARDLASMYQHATEAAIRAWSMSNEQVRRAQERVDDVRRRHLVSLLRHSGVDDERAELLASVGLAILVGLQQLQGGADKIPDAMHLYQSLVLAAIPPAG